MVDNGSTDGSAEFLREHFPQVKLLALPRNLGFGGGSNAGFRAAKNDIVVLLNSDMRVAPDFLAPLLEGFRDPDVFAVSCQIFFTDPDKLREETGLTQGWWQDGGLRVRHRDDPAVTDLFPCFYGGGGSLRLRPPEVSGTGRLRSPSGALLPGRHRPRLHGLEARLEGALPAAQHRVPRAPRHHREEVHAGADPGRAEEELPAVLLEEHPRVAAPGLAFLLRLERRGAGVLFGEVPLRAQPAARSGGRSGNCRRRCARAGARSRLAAVERYRGLPPPPGRLLPRPLRNAPDRAPERLRVLFVSPYPICPPVHGGGVFMYQTLREMAKLAEVHVMELLDWPWQETANQELRAFCASRGVAGAAQRPAARHGHRIEPHAVREFANDDLEWLIHRQIYLQQIDVLQLEYTPMAQYAANTGASSTRCSSTTSTSSRSAAASAISCRARRPDQGAHRIPARAALRAAACCPASTRCRCARRPIATTCSRFLPELGAAHARRPARRHRHRPLPLPAARARAAAPCSSSAASATIRTASRWTGSCAT